MLLLKVYFFLTSLTESHIIFLISLMVLLLMFISSSIVTCGLNCLGICTIGWLFSTSLHKDIRHSIVEIVNILKMWIQNKALIDLWIQQSQECPNQYKLLFHLLMISYTLLQCTRFIRKKSTLKFQWNHHSIVETIYIYIY